MREWLADKEHLGLLLFVWCVVVFYGSGPVTLALGYGQQSLELTLVIFAIGTIGPIIAIVIAHKGYRRPRPAGYIGKFRRTDGEIVHVARLPSGTLMMASETQPPQDLGPVSGPELARWQKLATEPDG